MLLPHVRACHAAMPMPFLQRRLHDIFSSRHADTAPLFATLLTPAAFAVSYDAFAIVTHVAVLHHTALLLYATMSPDVAAVAGFSPRRCFAYAYASALF